jgi:hypothetical protein
MPVDISVIVPHAPLYFLQEVASSNHWLHRGAR